MSDILFTDILYFLAVVAFLVLFYYIVRWLTFLFIKFCFRRKIILKTVSIKRLRRLSTLLAIGAIIYLLFKAATLTLGFSNVKDNSADTALLKISYYIPNAMAMGKKERITVRIEKTADGGKLITGKKNVSAQSGEPLSDTIPFNENMEVNVIETSHENKLSITRVNNNSRQQIDTSKFTEWLFDVTARDYGAANVGVSVSAILVKNGLQTAYDYRIHEAPITISATIFQKVFVFFRQYAVISIIVGVIIFLLLYRLLPEWVRGVRIIKLFMASSEELKTERTSFEIFINRENKKWRVRKLFIELILWEDFVNAMSKTSLQDEYNKSIKKCEICLLLFYTKVGTYTYSEFKIAYNEFMKNGKPLIFTYFKQSTDAVPVEPGVAELQRELAKLGHFYTKYNNTDDLLLQFDGQIEKLYGK